MKKLLALVLALVMTMGLATVGTNAAFADQSSVDSSKYSTAINVLTGMDVFKGYGEDNEFKPETKITRAQVAAIIYRIYTGDVKDAKIKNYIDLANFSDVKSTDWYAGYIGYCANAQFIKGYGDGTFGPNDQVTGYQTLAMILRAVGYDKNHEFEGKGYEVEVARVAQQLGMLTNVAAEDLNLPINREAVAQILFDAVQAPQVTYTAAFGYNQYETPGLMTEATQNPSLGWQNFGLNKVNNVTIDAWGRLADIWYGESGAKKDATGSWANAKATSAYSSSSDKTFYTMKNTPLFTSNTVAKGCDIVDAGVPAGAARIASTNHWVNGQTSVDRPATLPNGTTNPNAIPAVTITDSVAATYGAVGRQIEFYKYTGASTYRMVEIDTYLARVTGVTTEVKDANGHVIRDAYNTLAVYNAPTNRTARGFMANAANNPVIYLAGNDYAEGDWILVNVDQDSESGAAGSFYVGYVADYDDTCSSTELILATGAAKTEQLYVEDVGKAEYVDAAQTINFWNAAQHEIGGKVYDNAVQLNLDVAGRTATQRMRWFFDQFGNVIGDIELDRDNYAVLKNLVWIVGNPGHAEATLVYFDGTEETKAVASIDGIGAGAWLNNGLGGDSGLLISDTAIGFAATTRVSEEPRLNGNTFAGVALYNVRTLDNGAVTLEGWTDATLPLNNIPDFAETVSHFAPRAAVGASPAISADNSAIVDANAAPAQLYDFDGVAGGIQGFYLNDNTKFIVRTGTSWANYVYTTYTRSTLPAYASRSMNMFVVDSNNDGIADFVYIQDSTLAGLAGTHYVFIKNGTYSQVPGTNTYTMTEVLDGVDNTQFTIVADGTNAGALAMAQRLAAGKGKLFQVTYGPLNTATNGLIVAAALTNEANDEDAPNDVASIGAAATGDVNYAGRAETVNYAANTITFRNAGGVTAGYTTTATTPVYMYNPLTNTTTVGTVADLPATVTGGVWVTYTDAGAAMFKPANAIYVGRALSTSTALTAQAFANEGNAYAGFAANVLATGVATTATWYDVTMPAGATNAWMRYTPANGGTLAVNGNTKSAPTATDATVLVNPTVVSNVSGLTTSNVYVATIALNSTTENNTAAGVGTDTEELVVTAEDGWNFATVTVDTDYSAPITTAVSRDLIINTTVVGAGSTKTTAGATTADSVAALEAAIAAATDISLSGKGLAGLPSYAVSFTDNAAAVHFVGVYASAARTNTTDPMYNIATNGITLTAADVNSPAGELPVGSYVVVAEAAGAGLATSYTVFRIVA